MSIPAATEAFSDSMRPFMGSATVRSHFSSVSRAMPSPSEPITSAMGPLKSAVKAFSPSMAVPTTHMFFSWSASMTRFRFFTLAMGM